ncbi:unnamed protein product [Peronospora destructor]|uniref:PDZ domain-containing protein n=1 Tax=Peronospora destructor TaxID=86335 RepID=A0AAV0TYI1_9STRA|nr:unnamed protein product [Peronospora destructor]
MSPSSRRSATNEPLTAERALMDHIRSKLERAQRRLARNSPGSSGSVASSSSTYIPSSSEGYTKPAVKSVLLEDMPATASRQYVPPSCSTRPSSSSSSRELPPPSSHCRPCLPSSSSSTQSLKYGQDPSQLKDLDADPLNGGPFPLSTPSVVCSTPRVSRTSSSQYKNERLLRNADNPGPPSAMRSGVARPPNSRVRFEGQEKKESQTRSDKREQTSRETTDRKQRYDQMKECHRNRDKAEKPDKGYANKGTGPLPPIARSHRSALVDNLPNSAIKLSAYDDIVQTIPTSPIGRPRRSSIGNPPPKSDIKVSAFDNVISRHRSSQEKQSKLTANEEAVKVVVVDTKHNQKVVEQVHVEPTPTIGVKSLPSSSGVPESELPTSVSDEDDTSANETDDSYDYEFSDFDTDSEDLASGYSVSKANNVIQKDVDRGFEEKIQAGKLELSSSPATELSLVKEEKEEETQPVSRLTARDLALHALGRAGSSSLSDLGSPALSANGRNSSNNMPATKVGTSAARSNTPAPMSYTPASSAFPSARALGRRAPATTGRTRQPPLAASTSVSSYVRRSLPRAPMDLKNHLPPSIGVLSGLSSGSSTFAMNPSHFYEVTWMLGEFAFSVQRVYTEENEYEFDDRNQEPQLFLRMLLNTERSTCKSFGNVRVGDVLIRVGDAYVSDLGLEGSGTVLTKFFAKLTGQTPIRLTFQRMSPSDWEGGVEL